jgi:hypothetical protein
MDNGMDRWMNMKDGMIIGNGHFESLRISETDLRTTNLHETFTE